MVLGVESSHDAVVEAKRRAPALTLRHTRYLLESGIGVRVQSLKELRRALDQLLGDAGALERMGESARSLARPHAAAAVAEMICELGP